ncbi:hypothetical protein [Campylobacter majalis]|uniref:hypothetical protein n=1 Tax=Campylobacter majalis TaxID=2790656 RepID=UPI001E4FD6F6|nr:hypothetical protein [Campylobacter majalis]
MKILRPVSVAMLKILPHMQTINTLNKTSMIKINLKNMAFIYNNTINTYEYIKQK